MGSTARSDAIEAETNTLTVVPPKHVCLPDTVELLVLLGEDELEAIFETSEFERAVRSRDIAAVARVEQSKRRSLRSSKVNARQVTPTVTPS